MVFKDQCDKTVFKYQLYLLLCLKEKVKRQFHSVKNW